MVHRELTILEAVALAVRSEMASIELYADLARKVKNCAVRNILNDLGADEEKHRRALMDLYREMLGGEEPFIPTEDGRDKRIELGPDPDYLAVITAARDKELDSETFYKEAADKVVDYKTRMFFLDVASSERHHAATLQRLAESLQEDPHCFDREDMDPFKAIHVGP